MKKSLAEIPLPGKQRKGQCIISCNKSEVKKTFTPPRLQIVKYYLLKYLP